MTAALILAAGYLLGSMPFGYWVVRALKGEDIRTHGSGNIGASNVWRTYGRRYGAPIVVLDVLKGFLPAVVGVAVGGDLVGILAGGAAMLGHWRPLFLGFSKGGKTVATAAGVFFGIAPLVALVAVGLWLALFAAFRYASLASMVAAVATPLVALALGESWVVVAFGSIAAFAVLLLHKANIRRLLAGTESRFRASRA